MAFEQYNKNENQVPIKKFETEVRKKNLWEKFTTSFFAETGKDLGQYLITGVIIPSVKRAMYDLCRKSVECVFYGRESVEKSGNGYHGYSSLDSGSNAFLSYTDYAKSKQQQTRVDAPRIAVDDILFKNKADAYEALGIISATIEGTSKHCCSVAVLMDMAGREYPYTYRSYGWTDVSTAGVVETPDGYILDLPRPKMIDIR